MQPQVGIVAPAGAAGKGPAPPPPQEQRNDQNGGDLHPIIVRLAAVAPAGCGEMPIDELLPLLKEKDPESFAAADRLSAAATVVAGLSDEEAIKWKDKGNAEFQHNKFSDSTLSYTHGLLAAKSSDVLATLLNNRSTALFQQKRLADACLDAHRAYVLKPGYWKALLRRGRCLEALGFAEQGARDVRAAERQVSSSAEEGSASAAVATASDEGDDATPNSEEAMAKLFGEVGVGVSELALPPRATLDVPVRVERSAKGRGLVAKERLDAGVTVLTETPYALVARAETLLSVCSYCLQFTSSLYQGEPFRAHGTKSRGFFCSAACAEAAWRYYGERECSNPFFFCCPNDALLAWHLMQGERMFPQLAEMNGCFADDFDPVSHNDLGAQHMRTLEGSHSKELMAAASTGPASGEGAEGSTVKDVGGYESVVACLALHMGAVANAAEAERMRKAQRQILLNAFPVQCVIRVAAGKGGGGGGGGSDATAGMVTANTVAHVGTALYAVAALVNHACDPNCFVSFYNNPQGSSAQLVLRTIRPVMEGEELTVAYAGIDIFHFHSMRHRLRTLRDRFGFICRCNACMNQVDEPVRENAKEAYIKAADYYQKGRRLIREGKPDVAVTVLLQSYEMVMRDICPPPQAPQMMVPKTHDALALAYFQLGNRSKCVEHLKAALDTDVAVHKGNANRVGLINEYTRLAFSAIAPEERKAYAEKAVALLRRFYAPSPTLDVQVAYVESSYKAAQGTVA